MSDLEAQLGGGSTPGATELRQIIADTIGDIVGEFNSGGNIPDINITCPTEMDSIMKAIDTAVRTRLLSLPSMADDETHHPALKYDTAYWTGRNQLRASLRAEVGQSHTERPR